ncbi:hypothetical protein SD70_29700 [Gordoniibacillus kamchatkensis]|uniref:Uncharacterized protein n=1 Tax=Gordoniibacillus kamchatkensis TaxID=1590651 RepID=A0ABR5ABI8_9BACL|nr:hypothetical protein SD70_29700 [Paenibacillus sp. VKM B-2647]
MSLTKVEPDVMDSFSNPPELYLQILKPVGKCAYSRCRENIYPGDSCWIHADEHYCNAVHFALEQGAEKTIA